MITAEQSQKNTELILQFCNIFRENPIITLEEFKKERKKEIKENMVKQ